MSGIKARLDAISAIIGYKPAHAPLNFSETKPTDVFGCNVFSDKVMRERLPKHVYKSLKKTIELGEKLDRLAGEDFAVANSAEKMLECLERALKDVQDALGGAGTMDPERVPDAAALLADLLTDLVTGLVPHSARAGRSERLHLQGRLGVVEPDGDDALGLLLDFETHVQALAWQHLDAAEVDVGPHRIRFGIIERSRRRAIGRRGLSHKFIAHAPAPV